jgi:hypothetical protein
MSNRELLERFMALFHGSPRSFGQWEPPNNNLTEKARVGQKHYLAHLRGERGLGLVPILDDNTCWFAVIDIDCHGEDDPEIDIMELAAKIEHENLPLLPCRSKSGGAHCYVFGATALMATAVTAALVKWSQTIGWAGHEIFPKQTKLLMNDGELQLGNWINLPYFQARDTIRYAVRGGKRLSIEEFVDAAEELRITPERLVELAGSVNDHADAPPCFQRMMAERVPDGFRNEALYNATVYLRRAFEQDWNERALAFNDTALITPLPDVEAKRTIKSSSRRDYSYKCNQEPIKSLCNRTVCLTRKFGITPKNVVGDPGAEPMAEVTAVRRYNSDPPRYELTADNVAVSCTRDVLQDWRLLRKLLQDALRRLMPEMKPQTYDKEFLGRYLQMIEDVVVPEDASPQGLARARLAEWLKKATIADKPEQRQAVLRKQPVRCDLNGELVYMFRSQDFVDHLRRARAEELRGLELFHAILPMGLTVKNVRIGKTPIRLWVLPASVTEDEELDPKTFTTEF